MGRKPSEKLNLLWSKSLREDHSKWHTLLNHLLDTGAVAQILWERCLSESFKNDIALNFGIEIKSAGDLISFWVSLHDIGKAGPEFQKKNSQLAQNLINAGLSFPETPLHPIGFHATATTIILRRLFKEADSHMPRAFRTMLAITLGGHHGQFPSNGEIADPEIERIHVGDEAWHELQKELYLICQETLFPAEPFRFPQGLAEINPLMLLLAGLTTAADWISSNEEYFPYQHEPVPADIYFSEARERAMKAVQTLGWTGWQASHTPMTFEELFPGFQPNPMQQSVISLAERTHSPFLVIVEAQTGSGKTEAALYMADTLLQRENKAGIYVAMPNQATSNQMYERVRSFLSERYPNDRINLHLLHSKALLMELDKTFVPNNIWSDEAEEKANIESCTWFLPRKRTLLAPFGVGTVDQAFLAILRSKHFFLRLFGLSHKIVIFDEVHAYDIYMTELFKTLLHWLHAVGTSVIILTATLPEQKKLELLQAFSNRNDLPEPQLFPRISVASESGIGIIQAGPQNPKTISLEWIDKNVQTLVTRLDGKLSAGGCAAVICNTVNRAQEVFQALKTWYDGTETQLQLFHSRFPFCWRKEIEENVLERFGKGSSNRPQRAILVATQVVEQSLDLDFDLMVTDLAPVDLLIQRIGRLHRHESHNPRPGKLAQPTCIISSFVTLDEVMQKGGDRFIYEPYILGKTFKVLQDKNFLHLPSETDELIRQVYDDAGPLEDPALSKAKSKLEQDASASRQNAHNYLIPERDKGFIGSQVNFFGDDEGSYSKSRLNAPTREIDQSLKIVCLEEEEDGLHLVSDGQLIDLVAPIPKDRIQSLLEAELNITAGEIIAALLNTTSPTPACFKTIPALRWHIPVIFHHGVSQVGNYTLLLERKKGLSFKSSKEELKIL